MTNVARPARPHRVLAPSTPIHHNLTVAAQRYPSRTAISFFGKEISYQEFDDTVECIAGWLQHEGGISRGDRVALYMQNSPQWLLAYYAVLRADAIIVPINPMNRASEVKHYLEDSGASVVFCAGELLEQLTASGTDTHTVVVDYTDYLPSNSDYIVPAWLKQALPELGSGQTPWSAVISPRQGDRPKARPSQARPEDIAGIFYTSGSTGVPKGCAISHQAYQHNIASLSAWHWLAPGTNCLATAPMSHVSGLNHGVHIPIYLGGASVILPRWDAALAIDLIRRYQVGHASIAPAAVSDMIDHPSLTDGALKSLPRITAGGAPMPRSVADKLMEKAGIQFIEAYGLTETSATTHLNPITQPKDGSAGVAFYGTEAVIFDASSGEPLENGLVGELAVRGPQLFSHYWNRPQDTQEAFITITGVSYFQTGDIGYIDESGYLFILDRAKRMINASGYKVWPAEVERQLRNCPGIKDVCIVATPDPYRGETVKAFVVRQPGSTLDAEAVIAWAKERMAAYKYPRVVEFLEQLPRSNVGKILWKELQDQEYQCNQHKAH